MNLRAVINIEEIREGRQYSLTLQQGSPWTEIYEVLENFAKCLKEQEAKQIASIPTQTVTTTTDAGE